MEFSNENRFEGILTKLRQWTFVDTQSIVQCSSETTGNFAPFSISQMTIYAKSIAFNILVASPQIKRKQL